MKEIVINACYGGFSLSKEAESELAKLQGKQVFWYMQTKYEHTGGINEYQRVDIHHKGHFYYSLSRDLGETINDIPDGEDVWFPSREIARDNVNLIAIVKKLGSRADGSCAKLKIVKIPDDVKWVIDEYDGYESVEEDHRSWV